MGREKQMQFYLLVILWKDVRASKHMDPERARGLLVYPLCFIDENILSPSKVPYLVKDYPLP